MMKDEFEKMADSKVTPEMWEKIELVYMYYDDKLDKTELVRLWKKFGWNIILAFLPKARAIRDAENALREAQRNLKKAQGAEELAQQMVAQARIGII